MCYFKQFYQENLDVRVVAFMSWGKASSSAELLKLFIAVLSGHSHI